MKTIDAILGYTPERSKTLAATLGRVEYTKHLRGLLKARGITGVSVTLGRGTAYGWTHVEIRYVDGESFEDREARVREINERLGFGGGLSSSVVISPSVDDRARFLMLFAGGWTWEQVHAAIPRDENGWWD